ncbi:MAG TPA: ABC transporter permease [Vicinamibacterales bacterium]|nr:ABC transporter permease [Vicinamibacterales bacterium]
MLQDFRYALRTFRRHPVVAGAAVLTLGLGIGGATAVFTVVDAVLLRPLPFHDPDRLVRLWARTPEGGRFPFSEPDYLDLSARTRTLQGVAAFNDAGGTAVLASGGEPQRITVVPITASLPDVLGVHAALGRMFTADEDRPASTDRPVVLSDGLWKRRFGADPLILGRTIQIDGQPAVVTGVMPARFDFPGHAEAWVPLSADPLRDRSDSELAVIGRLASGATLSQLRGELRDVMRRIGEGDPEARAGWSADAVFFSEWIVSPRFRQAVWAFSGAVGVLLLLACANVASLLVAQAATREGEMRIRAALGAGRRRLVRQLLTESSLLALLGTAAAVLVAAWSVAAIRALGAERVPRLDELHVDGSVLAFACLTGIASCLAFGLAPALHAARTDLRSGVDTLRYTGGNRRLRHALVVLEITLALVLLIGAGLLGHSFLRLMLVNPGFDTKHTIAMPLALSSSDDQEEQVARFYRDLLDRVRGVPGIAAAGATTTDPFRQFGFSNTVTPAERAAESPPGGLMQAGWRSVTPGYFEAMGVPLLSGRSFEASDSAGGERVVVVSESLARRLWPGDTPLGKRVYWGGTTGRTRLVIGVAGDIRDVRLEAEAGPMLFVPHTQVPVPAMTIVMRTSLGAGAVTSALRAAVRDLDPSLPAPPVHGIRASRFEAAASTRFNLTLIGAFAAVALTLAVTGVYAMLAFAVWERRREIAVRLALGASPPRIARLVLGTGLWLAIGGVLAGTAVALAATRILASLLYGVAPTDLLTFAAAGSALLAVAALASWLPARRAARLDPAVVLRDT